MPRLLGWAEQAARELHRGGQLVLPGSCLADKDGAVAPGHELCTVVAIAQGMDHALQDPERA